MSRSIRVIAVIMMLAMFASCLAVTASAATPEAAEEQQDMWWLIGILLVVLDLELITISTLGIVTALKRRKLADKTLSVVFPFLALAMMPAETPAFCTVLALCIVGAGVAIFLQIRRLLSLKAPKPEPEVEPEPEPEFVEEAVLIEEDVDQEAVAEALAAPVVVLEEIKYDDLVETEMEGGVEVISVVWPERKDHNKLYRYSPNGETLQPGDIVLVPTRDVMRERDVIRKAAVVRGNHRVDPETLHHKLKKIIGRVKHHEA